MKRRQWGLAAVVAISTLAWPALGQEPGPLLLEVHGIASQGFMLTTGNDYLVEASKHGSFQMSEIGINFSKALTDRLRFGVQFFAQNFGGGGSYLPQVDWFYLDYSRWDWLGLRAGRLKIPYGLYNDVNDIDAARIPVLLPQSVYPLQARSFLFAQTGAELYGFARSRAAGAIDYRLFVGTIFIDPRLVVPPGTMVELKFNVPYAFGGRLLWETPLPGLRLGASGLALHLDTVAFLPMGMTGELTNDSRLWGLSADFAVQALVVTAEYSRGHSKQESALPGNTIDVVSESGYLMLSYQATRWLHPALYYALSFPDVDQREGLANQQHDVSLTLRFDINQYWLVKAEGHYMAGTAGLVNPLRVGPPPADPERHWAVFLLKTTAYF
jgi:hypothetical protein